MINAYDFTGLTGVAISVYSYARVQWQREYAKRLAYSFLNLMAAVLIGISLLNAWSLAAFVGSIASALLSVYGMYRCVKYIQRENEEQRAPTARLKNWINRVRAGT